MILLRCGCKHKGIWGQIVEGHPCRGPETFTTQKKALWTTGIFGILLAIIAGINPVRVGLPWRECSNV